MIFWTFLLAALFTMSLLYVIWGPKKIWGVLISYALLSGAAIVVIHYNFSGLFTLDLIALGLPYLFVVPLHFFVHNIIKHYVLHDDTQTSIFFVAIYNRILIGLWGVLIIFLIGIGLAIMDGFLTSFSAPNIWSISVTGVCAVVLFVAIISLGYKKKFTYVLIVGDKDAKVYELNTHKSRLLVRNHIGIERVYPRGIYQEHGVMKYLYYTDAHINLEKGAFKPMDSELFEYLKDHAKSYESLEEVYNEYIEQMNSI